MSIRSEVLGWLREARSDLKHAKLSLGGGSYDWTCFAAQQAAEKAFKAFVVGIARRRPSHVHDLTRLYQKLGTNLTCRMKWPKESESSRHTTR